MRAAGDEYGQMVHRAVDYILDDEDAFRTFLSDGRIDMHNIAIERCLDISLWEDAIGFRQEVTSLPRIWHLCSGCWKVAN